MNQRGFSQAILLGIIAALILAGASGYVFISKQKLTPLTPSAPSTEITQEEALGSETSQEMEIATESIPKTEEVAPTEKKMGATAPKEPLPIGSGYASCADGTRHRQCSATQPLICISGKLDNDCRTCGCPNNRICAIGGHCVELLFPPEVVAPYNSWEKINPFLANLGVEVKFKYYDTTILPNDAEREQLKESLAYIMYIFEELFRDTPVKSFLKEFKEIRINYKVGASFSEIGGTFWRGDKDFFQISLLENFLSVEGIPSTDRYMIIAMHEIGHVVHENLSVVAPEIRSEFDGACWLDNQLKIVCQEREKSFVPMTMTIIKPFKDFESQRYAPPEYYALKNVKEDFAETFAAYIASPKEFRGLAAQYPILKQKYDFMKTNIFGGKEF